MIETKPTILELKDELDDLRRQRDYFARDDSQAEKRKILESRIERYQTMLKDLYGEHY